MRADSLVRAYLDETATDAPTNRPAGAHRGAVGRSASPGQTHPETTRRRGVRRGKPRHVGD